MRKVKKWINKKGKNKKEWNDFPSQADNKIRNNKYPKPKGAE